MQSHQGRQVLLEEADRPVNRGETVEPACQAQSRSEGRYQMVVPVWKGLEWGNHDVCHKQSKARGSVDIMHQAHGDAELGVTAIGSSSSGRAYSRLHVCKSSASSLI